MRAPSAVSNAAGDADQSERARAGHEVEAQPRQERGEVLRQLEVVELARWERGERGLGGREDRVVAGLDVRPQSRRVDELHEGGQPAPL